MDIKNIRGTNALKKSYSVRFWLFTR